MKTLADKLNAAITVVPSQSVHGAFAVAVDGIQRGYSAYATADAAADAAAQDRAFVSLAVRLARELEYDAAPSSEQAIEAAKVTP